MTWTRPFRRAGRRTNAALLVLSAGAFLSGWLAFAASSPGPATLTTVAHGLFGLAVVALAPWKSLIVLRAAVIPPAAWALVGLTVVCLLAGFVQFFLGYRVIEVLGLLPLSPIQVHVGAALLVLPLFVGHVLRRRRQPLRRADLSRRALLRTGAFTGAAALAYLASLGVARETRGSAGRLATGSGRIAAADIPATTWLLDKVPRLSPTEHRIDVAGRLVTVAELTVRARPMTARLDCTSGWYAEASWGATALSELIDPARLATARSIEVTSVTGYHRLFPVEEAAELWLATSCEGTRLSAGTGAPVRLVASRRRGFWWVKWVATVRLVDRPAWAQPPFPPQ